MSLVIERWAIFGTWVQDTAMEIPWDIDDDHCIIAMQRAYEDAAAARGSYRIVADQIVHGYFAIGEDN